jgi:hypothetical protein
MSWEQNIVSISRTAAADLSSSKNRFVALNSQAQIAVCGNGAQPVGVLRNNPLAGNIGTVGVNGVIRVLVGTVAVVPGPVKSDANGCAAIAVAATITGSNVVGSNVAGIALDSGNPGDVIPVLLTPGAGATPTTLA